MKITITKSEFRDAFHKAGRGKQFSYEGLGALFDYLERLEEDTGDEMELDVIGLCSEFTEYDSIEECAEYYGIKSDEVEENNKCEDLLCQLCDNSTVIEMDNGGIIIQAC